MDPKKKFDAMIQDKVNSLLKSDESIETILDELKSFADCFLIDWRNADQYEQDSIEFQIAHAIGINQILLMKKKTGRRSQYGINELHDTFVDKTIVDFIDSGTVIESTKSLRVKK